MHGLDDAPKHSDQSFLDLCASIAPRARSIQLDSIDLLEDRHTSIMEELFAHCVPGNLERLLMEDKKDVFTRGFIVAKDSGQFSSSRLLAERGRLLDVPHRHFEAVFQSVNVLHLDRVYPYWTSQAYHGLTKLLLAESYGLFIETCQLANIFGCSPQLRIIHLSIKVSEDATFGSPNSVRLNDLEALHHDFAAPEEYERVLPLILPGVAPLRVSIGAGQNRQSITSGEYREFFARSNVVRLEVVSEERGTPIVLSDLLKVIPNLEALFLDRLDIEPESDEKIVSGIGISGGHLLTELHLTDSTIDIEVLSHVTKTYPIKKLKVDKDECRVKKEGGMHSSSEAESWKDQLLRICPFTEFILVEDLGLADEEWS